MRLIVGINLPNIRNHNTAFIHSVSDDDFQNNELGLSVQVDKINGNTSLIGVKDWIDLIGCEIYYSKSEDINNKMIYDKIIVNNKYPSHQKAIKELQAKKTQMYKAIGICQTGPKIAQGTNRVYDNIYLHTITNIIPEYIAQSFYGLHVQEVEIHKARASLHNAKTWNHLIGCDVSFHGIVLGEWLEAQDVYALNTLSGNPIEISNKIKDALRRPEE